jgi:hypothetical protein
MSLGGSESAFGGTVEWGVFSEHVIEAAYLGDPDWIIITSWNEFGENTHIEPSEPGEPPPALRYFDSPVYLW